MIQLLKKVLENKEIIKKIIKYYCSVRFKINRRVYSIEESLQCINKGMSVCRFGEGEFKWILGIEQNSFQEESHKMSEELQKVLNSSNENVMICIPEIFNIKTYSKLTKQPRRYWSIELGENGLRFAKLLDKRKYYNLNITRFYLDYKDKSKAAHFFNMWKNIWKNENVVLVEGEKTRFGVGNDLLADTKNVSRILCPSQNAYEKKNDIEDYIKREIDNSCLVLVALGPTATIMAYDLSKKGFWAIDIGHLDIEYQWYLEKATEKKSLVGKYVNEAGGAGNEEFSAVILEQYKRQIIKKIGC